jgi:hypothetical protein
VAGPIVTTQSSYDNALKLPYAFGATVGRHVDYRRPGAATALWCRRPVRLGRCGPGTGVHNWEMEGPDASYRFEPGRIHNLESSAYIRTRKPLDPFIGAHADLHHPAVAHAVWSAALTAPG